MKKGLIIVGIFIGCFGLIASVVFLTLTLNMKNIKAEEIRDINVTEYEDQTLTGSYYYEEQIGATVEVEIENGEIVAITFIEHLYGLGGKAEVIVDDIIETQSLEVDAIAGATTSSHVIKLAVQNALEKTNE